MQDFLVFRRMLTPQLIQLFFWIGIFLCIAGAIYNLRHHSYLYALESLFILPLLLRVFCEFFILFFRMNETLTDLKNAVQRRPEGVQASNLSIKY